MFSCAPDRGRVRGLDCAAGTQPTDSARPGDRGAFSPSERARRGSRAARGDGPPFLALDGVGSNPNGGSAQFAASETGTFVYLSRPIGSAPMGGAPIQWMDRAGRRTPLRATSTNWGNPHFSPDGTRLAVEINDGKQLAVWVYDWEHDRESQLTLNAAQNQKPVWTPDGRRIAFWSNRDVQQNLYWQRADGTGDAQRLTNSPYPQSAASWHPGGRILAFQETRPQNRR